MRLVLPLLVLMAAGIPQALFAQAPQKVSLASQARPLSTIVVPRTTAPAKTKASSWRESPQTNPLLNTAGLRSKQGSPKLIGVEGANETPVALSSDLPAAVDATGRTPVIRLTQESEKPPTRTWRTLLVVQHSAAVFDAWSTRNAIQNAGARELNPFLSPFAHSNLIYAATQVGPALLDYLGHRMMYSRKSWVRRLWWVPQLAGTAGSLFSGAHNLAVARR